VLRYSFDDNLQSLDMRLTRSFLIRARLRVSLIADAFNVDNEANLSGYSGDLTSRPSANPRARPHRCSA
jgi:hypothetical protein